VVVGIIVTVGSGVNVAVVSGVNVGGTDVFVNGIVGTGVFVIWVVATGKLPQPVRNREIKTTLNRIWFMIFSFPREQSDSRMVVSMCVQLHKDMNAALFR
jgi:hypothetical protein